MTTGTAHEYINDFLYFVLRPFENKDSNTLLYCSGVDLYRFLPVTKGRHRPMANPAMRGLQLVNLGVRKLALESGATPKAIKGDTCTGIVPPKTGWYKEQLLIENAPDTLPETIISYAVQELFRKIDTAIMLGADLPDRLLPPDELQVFIEGMCLKYGK